MITKEPKDKSHFLQNRYFTKNARSAFLHILRKVRDDGKTLLLPAYIGMNDYEGSGVFDVVMISRIPYEFYTLDDQLSPELSSLESKADKTYVLLLIHYFGFPPANFSDVLNLCKQRNIEVIEDCAHTIGGRYNGKLLGSFGDYAFHSIHKILPTTDGGLLINNSAGEHFNIQVNEEGIKSETLSVFVLSEIDKINETRRKNYTFLLNHLSRGTGFTIVHNTLPDGVAPLNFPVLIHKGLRESIYFALQENNIPTCALYYKLIPQLNEAAYPGAHKFSNAILNLPVHQDTTEEDLVFICEKFNNLINRI